jgi:hypothetical protein
MIAVLRPIVEVRTAADDSAVVDDHQFAMDIANLRVSNKFEAYQDAPRRHSMRAPPPRSPPIARRRALSCPATHVGTLDISYNTGDSGSLTIIRAARQFRSQRVAGPRWLTYCDHYAPMRFRNDG